MFNLLPEIQAVLLPFAALFSTSVWENKLSSFLCEILFGQFFKERQVVTHFSYRVGPPMKFHFKRYEGQERIARLLSGHNLHRLCPALELLIKPLYDVCSP